MVISSLFQDSIILVTSREWAIRCMKRWTSDHVREVMDMIVSSGGQLITLEGTLKYREVEDDVEGHSFKHRLAEIHATSMKRLSKIEAQNEPEDEPGDGAENE